jgi:hypothetical protein
MPQTHPPLTPNTNRLFGKGGNKKDYSNILKYKSNKS